MKKIMSIHRFRERKKHEKIVTRREKKEADKKKRNGRESERERERKIKTKREKEKERLSEKERERESERENDAFKSLCTKQCVSIAQCMNIIEKVCRSGRVPHVKSLVDVMPNPHSHECLARANCLLVRVSSCGSIPGFRELQRVIHQLSRKKCYILLINVIVKICCSRYCFAC